MDRRKSLGLAKATKETTFREEDENQDEIYGARPRDVSKYQLKGNKTHQLYHLKKKLKNM